MVKIHLKKTKIEYNNLFFCLSIMYSSLVFLTTNAIRSVVGNTRKLDTAFVYGLIFLLIIKVLPLILHSLNKTDFLLFGFLAVSICVSLLYHNSNFELTITVVMDIVPQCVFAYFGGKLARTTPRLAIYARIAAVIVLLQALATTYVFHEDSFKKGYSQFDGYLLLFAMGLLFVAWLSAGIKWDYILATIILVSCLLTGARGPFLLCALLFAYALYRINADSKYVVVGLILLALFCAVIFLFWVDILLFLSSHFGSSASVRSITKLLEGEFFTDSLRISHYTWSLEYIKQHLFWGCGLVNDRLLIKQAFPELGELIGCYPHNFFLEVGMQYGAVLGLAISLLLGRTVIKQYRCCEEKELLASLFAVGFLPLMVSGSYLNWPWFYALLGFCNRNAPVKARG